MTMTTYRSTGTSSTTFTFATSTSPPDALARDFDVTAVPLGDYARDPQTNAGYAARHPSWLRLARCPRRDRHLLIEALDNLLNNAIKHSEAGTSIAARSIALWARKGLKHAP